MSKHKSQNESNLKDLEQFLIEKILKSKNKIKGKHFPISESVDNRVNIISVKNVFRIDDNVKNLFIILGTSKENPRTMKYYLTVQLATQSSDLLVRIAEKFAKANDLSLVQYTLFPKTFRVSLFALKIINTAEEYSKIIALLKQYKVNFQQKLKTISTLMGNEWVSLI